MSNETEVKPEVIVKEGETVVEKTKFSGGEIHIVADGNTGAMNVQAPQDLIVALGMLETAKMIIIRNMQDNVAKAQREQALAPRPAIIPAGTNALAKLDALRPQGRG